MVYVADNQWMKIILLLRTLPNFTELHMSQCLTENLIPLLILRSNFAVPNSIDQASTKTCKANQTKASKTLNYRLFGNVFPIGLTAGAKKEKSLSNFAIPIPQNKSSVCFKEVEGSNFYDRRYAQLLKRECRTLKGIDVS